MRLYALFIGLFVSQFWGIARAESENLAKDLFPGSKLIWEKKFEGRVMDFQVRGENIIVFEAFRYIDMETRTLVRLREDWNYSVTYLDCEGNIIWKKWFKEEYGKLPETSLETVKGRVSNISVSRDGEYVVINQYWGFFPAFLASCYDNKGDLVWEIKCEEPGLTISPYGSYAISTRQEGEQMMGHFIIVDNRGRKLWEDTERESFEDENGRFRGQINWTATWLDDSTVAWVKGSPVGSYSCRHPYCKLVLFDVKRLQPRWEVDIGKELGDEAHFGMSWYTPPIKTSRDGEFIAIAVDWREKNEKGAYIGMAEKRTLVVLDNKGSILWHRSDFVTVEHREIKGMRLGGLEAVSFTKDSKHLIATSTPTAAIPLTIDFFNVLTGERKWRKALEKGWYCPDVSERIWNWFMVDESLITNFRKGNEGEVGVTFNLKKGGVWKELGECITPMPSYRDKIETLIFLDKDRRRIQLVALEEY